MLRDTDGHLNQNQAPFRWFVVSLIFSTIDCGRGEPPDTHTLALARSGAADKRLFSAGRAHPFALAPSRLEPSSRQDMCARASAGRGCARVSRLMASASFHRANNIDAPRRCWRRSRRGRRGRRCRRRAAHLPGLRGGVRPRSGRSGRADRSSFPASLPPPSVPSLAPPCSYHSSPSDPPPPRITLLHFIHFAFHPITILPSLHLSATSSARRQLINRPSDRTPQIKLPDCHPY